MENSVKTITNFYRPCICKSFQLNKTTRSILSESEDKIKADIDSPTNIIPVGIADGAKRNKEFKHVLDLFDVVSLSNIEIIKKFEVEYWPNPNKLSPQITTPSEFELSPDYDSLLKQVDQQTQRFVAELHEDKRYSIQTLSSIFSLDSFVVNRIIKRTRKILAIKKKVLARSSRQRKLNATHIDFIRQLLTSAKSNFLSINSIKKKLLTNFEEISDISDTTVRKIVSKDLRFRFKKLDKIEPKTMTKDSIRSFLENSLILLEIQSQCIEVVYIDEFTVSSRNYSNYGWAPKGSKGYLKHYENNFKMSFILAFSKNRIHGVVGSSQTSDSLVFKYFLCKTIEWIWTKLRQNLEDVVFVMDNHSIHKSEVIKNFIKK